MKKVAIVQSNYIPWKGYFDMIAAADEFILYDSVQYTRRDWRNRNQIKTTRGLQWITVPVLVKGRYFQTIRETEIDGTDWADTHWNAFCRNYRRAPHFEEVAAVFGPFYRDCRHTRLSELNEELIRMVCRFLGIHTKISHSWDYRLIDGQSERLADLCVQAGGTDYISGPLARNYIKEEYFTQRGVRLAWFDYSGYPEYPQLWGGFVHEVTILDLLFNCGRESPRYMKYVLPRGK